ncbi:HypC/HybG/HupF family hydrogenase formation chaperone|uniref:Hydrogenase maturation protein HypC n=1 Tax=Dendrosporobacter quercicolus TaxID=146817 RepID=A0A1G9QG53_9FIRM|nr:HypC/HybG/HupF family hydrogenase formation chaperone [Dendrosporobacter quercicolus]NSL48213.1 HypC/HybG/HupF family hydrogenase formation chaperone [Dendrosporobacter quercicolus DSM 1736]SDM09285.1 Hydrogenase maturation protein HypC [Dendrosporobacter quercicolus]
MCVGIPFKLIERHNEEGIGELDGVQRKLALQLVPGAQVGDYLLVHAGCALQIIDQTAAMETLEAFRAISDEIR